MGIYFILVSALFISLITDIKSRKILNIVTIPTAIFGLMYYSITQGWNGFIFSALGLFVGIGVLIIPFLLGGMGAGDVKLMGTIGALMGTSFVINSFFYTALIGGAISTFLIFKSNGFTNSPKAFFSKIHLFRDIPGSFSMSKEKKNSLSFPYGIAIVLGTFCTLVWGGL